MHFMLLIEHPMMNPEWRYEIITRGLEEITGSSDLKKLLESGNEVRVYWGTATTGKPHVAYLVPLLKIRDFLTAGCTVKILLADLHAYLDSMKSPMEMIASRCIYYKSVISAALEYMDVDVSNVQFIRGSEYQKSVDFIRNVYKLCSITSYRDAKRAGSQVVKQQDDPCIGSLLYPIMQGLDEHHLDVDVQFGGTDQRKIFMYSEEFLPKMGHKKRIHLMSHMMSGLANGKMSSSDEHSKIDLVDDPGSISSKVKSASITEDVYSSGILQLIKFVLLPMCDVKKMNFEVIDSNGAVRRYDEFEGIMRDIRSGAISQDGIKNTVTRMLNAITGFIRSKVDDKIVGDAYPQEAR